MTIITTERHNLTVSYDETRPLGRGGVGTVFACEERPDLAVKVFDDPLPADVLASARLQASCYEHLCLGGVAAIYDLASPGAVLMRRVAGRPLRDVIPGLATPLAALRLGLRVCRLLVTVNHGPKGMVHTDVNSDNVFVDPPESARLIDPDALTPARVRLASGQPCRPAPLAFGTADYTRPERVDHVRSGTPWEMTAADQDFALACLLFELHHGGYHPTRAAGAAAVGDPAELLKQRFVPKYTHPHLAPDYGPVARGLPDSIDRLLARALCGEEKGRPTAEEFFVAHVFALLALGDDSVAAGPGPEEMVTLTPADAPESPRRRVSFKAGRLEALVAIAAFGGLAAACRDRWLPLLTSTPPAPAKKLTSRPPFLPPLEETP